MADESHVLGGLELNDGIYRKVLAHSFRPAQEKPDLIGGSDAEGVVLGRKPKPGPLEHEITVRIRQQATWDAASNLVSEIVQRAAECANRPAGLPHVWTPQGGTEGFTAFVLHAQVTEVPISQSDDGAGWGWLDRSPVLKIALVCMPYWYLDEVEGEPVTSSDPVVTVTLSGVTGDVDAEGEIVVTDEAGEPRRHLEWGLESRLLDPSTDYVLTADDLETSGYAAVPGTRDGVDVVTAVVGVTPTALCAIPPQDHVGRFKVRARVYCTQADVRLRLMYRAGSRPFEPTQERWASPPTTGWCDVDFGEIVVRPAVIGAQAWEGRIEAYNTRTDTTVDIGDEVMILPVERYGCARAHYAHDTGLLVADDRLDAITGDLDGETARLGGTWDTSGATTDFADSGVVSLVSRSPLASRSTTSDASPRIALLPAGGYTDIEIGVLYYVEGGFVVAVTGAPRHHGVVARWLDAANYLRLSHQVTTSPGDVWVEKVVAGVPTTLAEFGGPLIDAEYYYLRLVVFETGLGVATWLSPARTVLDERMFWDEDLASGGALDTGDAGIIDMNGSAVASERYYGEFYMALPTEPLVMSPNKSLVIRHDSVLREGPDDLWGEPWYRGDRVLIPPAGYMDRDTRIAIKARRDDVDVTNNTETGASMTVQVNYTPRFRMPARVA